MLFNSYTFIFVFLPITLLGFFQLARVGYAYAAAWLAAASLAFYGYWNPAYVGLLLGSIACNYTFGVWISKANVRNETGRKKRILIAALALNLSLLGYFKYANFFLQSVNGVAHTHLSAGGIILPLGISFFTFTQIAYLVDACQGKVKEYNFTHYVLFVTYFPHLIAGPILHHKEMMPQFAHASTYRVNWEHVATGLMLFTLGLCKKTLIADAFAPFANDVFGNVGQGALPTVYEAWAGSLAYTVQIYFDFSGYTDMALGAALMFGIRLPANFDSPYKAGSIIDFWRRWHMTLSRFLRDYLYIPLGGNRQGRARRYVNLMATMLLGGLWHGAGWTYVVWGALHGAYLTINHLWRERFPARPTHWLYRAGCGALTFIAVVAAWAVFRAENIAEALTLLKAMFGLESRPISFEDVTRGRLLLTSDLSGRDLVRWLAYALAWIWLLPNSARLRFFQGGVALSLVQAAGTVYFLYLAIDQFGSYSPFLYFQF